MGLKVVIDSLEAVPEPLREHYTQAADGKYRLEADDIPDVGNLKSALQKEREARETGERALKELRKQIEGLDPEKAREALKKLQEIEAKQLLGGMDEKAAEEYVAKRTETMRADWQSREQRYQEELKATMDARGKAEGRLSELLVDGTLKDAAVKHGVKPTLLTALIRMARAGDIDGIRWELREGQPVPVAGDAIKYGKDPSRAMSPSEYIEMVAQKLPDLFEPSSGGGAQPGGSAGTGSGAFAISEAQARDPQAYRAAKAAAEKAGQTLVIQRSA